MILLRGREVSFINELTGLVDVIGDKVNPEYDIDKSGLLIVVIVDTGIPVRLHQD